MKICPKCNEEVEWLYDSRRIVGIKGDDGHVYEWIDHDYFMFGCEACVEDYHMPTNADIADFVKRFIERKQRGFGL